MSHIFISYSTANAPYANRLAERLQAEGFDVWIDNSQLHSSDNWWESIVVAVYQCAAFIVIMSPEARESRWIQREVMLADIWKKPIFPLLLEGKNWEILVLTQYHDVRNRRLPTRQFYDKLADYALRRQYGEDVTSPARADQPELDTTVLEQIADPPKPEDVALSNRETKRPFGCLTEPVAILIAAVITGAFVIAAALIERGPVADTPDLTATYAITQTAQALMRAETVTDLPPRTDVPPSLTEIPVSTTSILTTEYLCDAVIISPNSSNRLRIVKQFPRADAAVVGSVNRGDAVKILDVSKGDMPVFYRIEVNGVAVGWVASGYMDLSDNCPI